MMSKRILLALRTTLGNLKYSIIEYAEKAGWELEYFPNNIPAGWYGDGVIVDAFSWEELKNIRDYDKIPIVSCRQLPERDNVRLVLGDTGEIAKIIADSFIEQGFKNFISFTTHPLINKPPHEVALIMPDWALKFELESRGYSLQMCYLHDESVKEADLSFQESVMRLRKFLRKQPKPCACFTTNTHSLYIFYRACKEENIKVPHEIAFIANNDLPEITEHTNPTTSAIVGEIQSTGFWLAKTLNSMMNGEFVEKTPKRIAPSGIIRRQSTDILAVPHLQTAQAINFLLSNYMNYISVQDAAFHANLTHNMMNYLFKKHINKSPGQLLREVRMNKARELLTKTKLPLHKIASSIGYGSAMAFSLAFKRECGICPGEYRAVTNNL